MSRFYSSGRTRQDEYDEKEQVKRRSARGAVITMIVFALAIVAVLIYGYIKKKTTYTSWAEVSSYDTIPNGKIIRTDNGFIVYNNDGALGYDINNRSSWRISYDLMDPIAAASGDYAAFAERGGRIIHVTNGSGSNDVINVSEKIYDICIASQGVTAVRTDAEENDHIYLYDYSGNLLLDIRTDVRSAGFPVSMALSGDAHKLVTSYIKIGRSQETWVTFYNFGDVGQNYADKVVGSYSFTDEFIPDVRFLTDDRVLIAGSDTSVLYKFREVPEEITRYTFDAGISSVASDESGFVLAVPRKDGLKTLNIYDLNGSQTGTIETGMQYDHITKGNNEVILALGDAAVIYRNNGAEKFRSRFDVNIQLIFPNRGDTTYTIVAENAAKMIRLTTKSEENQGFAAIE